MFSNILIYFVVIPLLMLGGLALCRNIRQIRAVAVTGSVALTALSVYLLVEYLAQRAAGATDPMLFTGEWSWFAPLNINLAVGVDGISIAMLLLSSIIVSPARSHHGRYPSPKSSSFGSSSCRPASSASSSRLTSSPCSCSMRSPSSRCIFSSVSGARDARTTRP